MNKTWPEKLVNCPVNFSGSSVRSAWSGSYLRGVDDYPKMYLYRRIVQAKLFIDQHYAEYIAVGEIADEAWFSKFHFIRLFRKSYGRTPHQYLTAVRLEKAKLLLQNGLEVAEVCDAVGFESVSSFTGLFKRAVKLTPAAYRGQQLNRRREATLRPVQFVPGCFAAAIRGGSVK